MLQQGVPGVIRTFNAKNGWGFLASDQAERDIYFQKRALQKEVKDCLEEDGFIDIVGHSVTCSLTYTSDGKPQASDVVLTCMKEDDYLVGSVRSYSEKNGYGFLNCTGYEAGIFFKLKFVPPHLQGPGGLVGQPCRFNLKITEDGKPQANTVAFKKPMGAPMQVMMGGMQKGGVQVPQRAPMMYQPMPAMQMAQFGKGMALAGGKGGESDKAISGVVISYNPAKGFGFIQSKNAPGDIYFKAPGDFSAGSPVSFFLKYTQDGKPQANNVTPAISEGEQVIGSIKSFFPSKGIGFLTAPGQPADIYFKAQVLPSELMGQQDLVGKQMRVTVSVKPDGKMEVSSASFAGHGGMGAKRPVADIHPSHAMSPAQKRQNTAATPTPGFFQCTVRSYNAVKRWGFLSSPQLGDDIYFQGRLLPPQYQGMSLEGAHGTCEVKYTVDGKAQAASLQLQ